MLNLSIVDPMYLLVILDETVFWQGLLGPAIDAFVRKTAYTIPLRTAILQTALRILSLSA